MSTLVQVMSGLADTVETNTTGLRCYSYVPEDLSPPALVLALGPIERGAMSMGQMEIRVTAVLFVSSANAPSGQTAENAFAGWGVAQSVWNAVDDNPGLGLADTNAAVLRYEPFGIEQVAAYGYLGGTFEVLILTAGAT